MHAWPVALLLGPLGWSTWLRRLAGSGLVVLLTVLTQILGLLLWPVLGLAAGRQVPAWLPWLAALGIVAGSGPVVAPLASLGGRVPLPCSGDELGPRSLVYCLAHRHYVRPALHDELSAVAREVAERHPGSVVRYLDAGFPFAGLPLLPHLSHHDGRKVDLALFGDGGSPLGYFGYVAPDRSPACPPRWLDLRWDFDLLQPLLALDLDAERTATLLRATTARPGIGKVLLEPHLERRLGVRSSKIRFQGCGAARHDDHVHVQL